MQKLKIKIADYFIVGFVLLLGLIGFWFNLQEAGASGQKYAVIYVENEQVTELSLSPGDSFDYSLNFGRNEQNTAAIEVEDGRIRMLPMGEELCPRAICSHTGWIEHSYESIVCLPNQIMIVFEKGTTGKDDHDIDGVTY